MQSRAAGGGLDSLTEEIALPEAALSELAAAGVLHSSSGGGKSAALAPEGSAALEGQGQSEDGMGLDGGPQLSGAWMDSPVKRPRSAAADPSFTAEFRELTDVQCQREIEAEFVRAAGPAPPVDPAMQQILVSRPSHLLPPWGARLCGVKLSWCMYCARMCGAAVGLVALSIMLSQEAPPQALHHLTLPLSERRRLSCPATLSSLCAASSPTTPTSTCTSTWPAATAACA